MQTKQQVAIIVVVALLAAVLGAAITLQVIGGQVVTKALTGATDLTILRLGDGSASAPALGFTSDTNVGLYRSGADTLDFSAGGSLRASLSSSGLNMQNLPVLNVGAAGTDFGTNGSLTLAQALTVTAGSVSFPSSSVANAALAAPNSLVVLSSGYAGSFNNVTETEIARWQSPIAMTAITATASAQSVTGILTFTLWINGSRQLCQLNVSTARSTTLCSTAQFTPSVSANNAITVGVTAAASDYVTDTFVSLILKAVHQ